ncbi:RNA-directed DNA polymerase from mobile element jockey-like [Brachionus plicatilis]|uniref:RNA-directed DNA polymerase from mobile element jockey-like n=1 Tax=Brachionus plicatilis TaxID=10195 RepID=A0A3M7R9Y1_BRAPC|nr:RNA-directed DNA polymerase from mobile element jockey-like [Brachionus plicatilis]
MTSAIIEFYSITQLRKSFPSKLEMILQVRDCQACFLFKKSGPTIKSYFELQHDNFLNVLAYDVHYLSLYQDNSVSLSYYSTTDKIVCNEKGIFIISPPLDGNSSRYHCNLSFQLHSRAARSQAFYSRTLHWRSGDFAALSEYFKNYNWQGAVQKGSVQNSYSNFLGIFGEAAKLFVKRRWKKPLNAKPPWWNYEVASLVRQKRRSFIRKRIDSHNEQLGSKHIDLCKRVKHVVKKSIIEYEMKLVQAAKKNPKQIYSYMNRHYSSRESIAALTDIDNKIVTDKVFEPPPSREVVVSAEASFKVRARADPCFTIEDVVTPEKVLAKLKNLNSDKSAGVDQIGTHPLKMCAESLKGITLDSKFTFSLMVDELKTRHEIVIGFALMHNPHNAENIRKFY